MNLRLVGTLLLALPAQVQAQGWFERVTEISSGLVSIALLVFIVALIPAAWSFRRTFKMVRERLDRIHGDLAPLLRHANSIADDVNYVTTSIRADMQQVNQTIAAANRRLLDAVDKAEDRITELNALVTVAQEEAESAFISTASTLRGIKTGAAALAGGRRRRPALDQSFEEEEEFDGNDGRTAADGRS